MRGERDATTRLRTYSAAVRTLKRQGVAHFLEQHYRRGFPWRSNAVKMARFASPLRMAAAAAGYEPRKTTQMLRRTSWSAGGAAYSVRPSGDPAPSPGFGVFLLPLSQGKRAGDAANLKILPK